MNLDTIKEDIKNLLDKEVMIRITSSRGKNIIHKGIINNVYSNIFTVLVEGSNISFTYSDVAIGDVKIYNL